MAVMNVSQIFKLLSSQPAAKNLLETPIQEIEKEVEAIISPNFRGDLTMVNWAWAFRMWWSGTSRQIHRLRKETVAYLKTVGIGFLPS